MMKVQKATQRGIDGDVSEGKLLLFSDVETFTVSVHPSSKRAAAAEEEELYLRKTTLINGNK